MNREKLEETAKLFAQLMGEANFSSRRGVVAMDIGVCVYNNNPYSDPRWRRIEHQRFARWCEGAGIKILADVTWGEYRDDEGYTRVLILDASPTVADEIHAAYMDAIETKFAKEIDVHA